MSDTPLLDALIQATSQIGLPLHVPGHKQGRLLPGVLSAWLGTAAKLDLTELPGLDNFFQPEGCILASQQLASRHYGSEHTYYSVNGSSAGVMAALLALTMGRKVLLAGSFHTSAWRGLIVSGAHPICTPIRFRADAGVPSPAAAEDVATALQRHPDVSAVFVTSPDYLGQTAPIAEICAVAHARQIPVIVDEAHGAHFGLTPLLPPHSVAVGADVVIQSTHKMLPALTGTAWVHTQGTRVLPQRIEESLLLLHTTSPSYLLLASLDAAQAWLRLEGSSTAARSIRHLQAIHELPLVRTTDDPFKVWIPTGDIAISRSVSAALRQRGIMPEYSDVVGVLCVFGVKVTERDVERFLDACTDLPLPCSLDDGTRLLPALFAEMSNADLVCSPREAYRRAREWVSVAAAAGRVAAQLVTPYPPGVPVVVPGQRLSPEICDRLAELQQLAYDVHGLQGGRVAVMTEAASRTLC